MLHWLCRNFMSSLELRNKVHFSAAVVAASIKPCIVIVLDTLFKHTPLTGALDLHLTLYWLCKILFQVYLAHTMVTLTYILPFTDFVKFNVESRKCYVHSRNKVHFSAAVIAGSIKPGIVIALYTRFKHALNLHFTHHWLYKFYVESENLR